jgi:hypothetical protein
MGSCKIGQEKWVGKELLIHLERGKSPKASGFVPIIKGFTGSRPFGGISSLVPVATRQGQNPASKTDPLHAEGKPYGPVISVPALAGGIGKAARTGHVSDLHGFLSPPPSD